MSQRGQVFKRGDSWNISYYDKDGARRQKGGFRTKAEANDVLQAQLRYVRTGHSGGSETFTTSRVRFLTSMTRVRVGSRL
jgi:hypothetical protein